MCCDLTAYVNLEIVFLLETGQGSEADRGLGPVGPGVEGRVAGSSRGGSEREKCRKPGPHHEHRAQPRHHLRRT